MKNFLKKIGLLIITLILAYLIFVIIGGGWGERELHKNPFKSNSIFLHKGGFNLFVPENSIDAIDIAHKEGFHYFEFDVRKTMDERLVLFHDNDGKRILNWNKRIDESIWEEIKELKINSRGRVTESTIPLLKDVLSRIEVEDIYYLDLKINSFSFVDSIASIIQELKIEDQILMASTNPIITIYIRSNYPEFKTVLEGIDGKKEWLYYLLPKNYKTDFYASSLKNVDKDHVKFLTSNKILDRKITYGVDEKNIHKINSLGLTHIIFDIDSTSVKTNKWNNFDK